MENKDYLKKLKSNKKLAGIFGFVFVCALAFAIFSFSPTLTAETSTVSNVTVASSLGFTFSANLTSGILYGTLQPNTNDNNATGNNISSGNTSYFVTMSSSNNAPADIQIKANAPLTSGANTIGNGNYTYDANSTINGANMNNAAGSIALSDTYVDAGTQALNANEIEYFQFYLDIPLGQQTGTYNNTISFNIKNTD